MKTRKLIPLVLTVALLVSAAPAAAQAPEPPTPGELAFPTQVQETMPDPTADSDPAAAQVFGPFTPDMLVNQDVVVPPNQTFLLAPGSYVLNTLSIGSGGKVRLQGNTEIELAWGRTHAPDPNTAALSIASNGSILCDLKPARSGENGQMVFDPNWRVCNVAAHDGTAGTAGEAGEHGCNLTLVVYGNAWLKSVTMWDIDLRGGAGGNGGAGGGGSYGCDGYGCNTSYMHPMREHNGIAGGNAGHGGAGGDGGDGGHLKLTVYGDLVATSHVYRATVNVDGGEGGAGGAGGKGGLGGRGGEGCYASGQLIEAPGAGGNAGRAGASGNAGRGGNAGTAEIWANTINGLRVSAAGGRGGNGGSGGSGGVATGGVTELKGVGTMVVGQPVTPLGSPTPPTQAMPGGNGGNGGAVTLHSVCALTNLAANLMGGAGGDGGAGGNNGYNTFSMWISQPGWDKFREPCDIANVACPAYQAGPGGTSGHGGDGGTLRVVAGSISASSANLAGGRSWRAGNGGTAESYGVNPPAHEGDSLAGAGGDGGVGGVGGRAEVRAATIEAWAPTMVGGNGGIAGNGGTWKHEGQDAAPAAPGKPGAAGMAGQDDQQVAAPPPLRIQATVNRSKALPETELRYTFAVEAPGAAQTQVQVQAPLPEHITFVSADPPTAPAAGVVTWNLAELPACTFRSFGLRGEIEAGTAIGTVIAEQAQVASQQQPSPVASNSVATTVAEDGALGVFAHANPSPALPAQDLTYALRVINPFSSDVGGVRLEAQVPAHTTFKSASPGGTHAGGKVSWVIGGLPAGGTVDHWFTVAVAAGLTTTDRLELQSQVYALDDQGGHQYDGYDSLTTPIGELGILWDEPLGNPKTAGNRQVLSGLVAGNRGALQPQDVTITFITHEPGGSFVFWDVRDVPLDTSWRFNTTTRLGALDNVISARIMANGTEVGSGEAAAQAEFFQWYEKLGYGKELLRQYSADYTIYEETKATKLTEAAYRGWLAERLINLAKAMPNDAHWAVATAIADFASMYKLLEKAGTAAKSAGGRILQRLGFGGGGSGPGLAERVLQRLEGWLLSQSASARQRLFNSLYAANQGYLTRLASQDVLNTALSGNTPPGLTDFWLGTFRGLLARALAAPGTFNEFMSGAMLGGIQQVLADMLQAAADLFFEQQQILTYGVLLGQVENPGLTELPGTRPGARNAQTAALHDIGGWLNSGLAQVGVQTGIYSRAAGNGLRDAGIVTSGVGLATGNPIAIAAGRIEEQVGTAISSASAGVRAAYGISFYAVLATRLVDGLTGIVTGSETAQAVAAPSVPRPTAMTGTPEIDALRASLLALRTAVAAGNDAVAEGNAILDAAAALDAREAALSLRYRQYALEATGAAGMTAAPFGNHAGYAHLVAAESLQRQAVATLLMAYLAAPGDADTQAALLSAIDAELDRGLTELQTAFDEAEAALAGVAGLTATAGIARLEAAAPFRADVFNPITLTLFNPGNAPAVDVRVVVTPSAGLVITPTAAVVDNLAAGATTAVSFQANAPAGAHEDAFLFEVRSGPLWLDAQALSLDAFPAPAWVTVDADGAALQVGQASLTLPGDAALVGAEVSLAAHGLPFGPGPNLELVGAAAYGVEASKGRTALTAFPAGTTLALTYPSGLPAALEDALGVYGIGADLAWRRLAAAHEPEANRFTLPLAAPGVVAVLIELPAGPAFEAGEGDAQVVLEWAAGNTGALAAAAAQYRIYRLAAADAASGWQLLATLPAPSAVYTDTAVVNGQRYVYIVNVVDAAGLEGVPVRVRSAMPHLAADFDGDGMPDQWEAAMQLDATRDDSGEDLDRDGLTNRQEYRARGLLAGGVHAVGTDPRNADSDLGGEPDGHEVAAGRDPLDATDDVPTSGPAQRLYLPLVVRQ